MQDVSVIIPSYNRCHTLKRALDSVLHQSYEPGEIILVDDGSEDDTALFIKKHYPNVIYIKQQRNHGVSYSRNHGIQVAKYPWIALLDSDDTWHKDKLAKQMQALQENPTYKICHTDEVWYRHGKFVNAMKKHQKYQGWIFEKCLPLCAISPSSVVIHESIFEDVDLFDETLPACEDYDLWLRITHKYPVLLCEEKLTFKYGGHEDQLSKKYWGMDRFRIRALAKLISSQCLSPENLAQAKHMLQHKIEIYLQGAKKRHKTEDIHFYEKLLKHAS